NMIYVKIYDGKFLCSKLFGLIVGKKAIINRIDTDTKYRFKGLGKKCISEFEQIAKERGATELFLASENEESHKFYKALNFKKDPQSTLYSRTIERD
ncbi:MAG: GNAT family N-acetyltransferase, partial [Alphaproteobacteria bacterium]|nr:GNAT family N-acetyltransferase [Alphaproteobacteria bacterium]